MAWFWLFAGASRSSSSSVLSSSVSLALPWGEDGNDTGVFAGLLPSSRV